MAKCCNKHPNWFKLKTERRQLLKELPPESAVNLLLACFDFLEFGSFPSAMRPIEKIAAAAFLPDLEEAWAKYEQRVNARASSKNTAHKSRAVSNDTERYHSTSCETEEETEPDQRLTEVLQKLPRPERETLMLRYFFGVSYKQQGFPSRIYHSMEPMRWTGFAGTQRP